MSSPMRLAAIDIGTVTTRMLVADVSDDALVEVARETAITHLGEDLTSTGRLGEESIVRVEGALSGFLGLAEERGVLGIAGVATSAARDAANGAEFLDRLEAIGLRPEIIPGDREAQLSFSGATYALDGEDILVVDLGGGSTELIFGLAEQRDGERVVDIESARSIDVGSRRLTELFLHADPPRPAELKEAAAWAAEEFRPYFDGLRRRPSIVVSLAGTATSLAAIKMELAVYDPDVVHGSVLTGADLSDLREELAALPLAERMQVVGLEPGRAGVIVAGALILETVLGMAGLDSTVVSEHDILYGIALGTYRTLRGR